MLFAYAVSVRRGVKGAPRCEGRGAVHAAAPAAT